MEPLKGLQTLGNAGLQVAAGISVAVALGSAVTPHMTTYLMDPSALQRTQSIPHLCLLLFVCFASPADGAIV